MKIRRYVNRIILKCFTPLHPMVDWYGRLRTYRRLFHLGDALRAAAAEKSRGDTVTLHLRRKDIPITLRCGTCDFVVFKKILIEREYALPFHVDA